MLMWQRISLKDANMVEDMSQSVDVTQDKLQHADGVKDELKCLRGR